MENEVKQRNQRNRRRERAQRMQAQRESKVKDGDSGEDESPAREKPPRPPARRKKSKEPLGEEDIIDGFAIMAFRTYEDLEAAVKCASSPRTNALSTKPRLPLAALASDAARNHPPNNVNSHGITLLQDAGTSDDSGRASERLTGSSVAPRDPDSSRDRLSDCDSEGDDDKASPENSRNASPRYHDASMDDASDAGSLFRVTGAAGAGGGGGVGVGGAGAGAKNELVARGGSGGALALSRAPVGGSASPAPAPLPQPAPSPAPAALPPPALPPPHFRADTPHRPNGAHIPTIEGHAATQIPAKPVGAAAGPDTPERPASNSNKLQPGARAAADSPTPAPPAPPAPSPLFPTHTAYQSQSQSHAAAALPDYRHTNHETRTEPPPERPPPPAPLDLHAHHAPRPPPHLAPAPPPPRAPPPDSRSPAAPSPALSSVPTSFPSRVNGAPGTAPHSTPSAIPSCLPSRAHSPAAPTSRPSYPPPAIGSSHVNSSLSSSIHGHTIPYQSQAGPQKHSVQSVYASRPSHLAPFSVAGHLTSSHAPTTASQPLAPHSAHQLGSHSIASHTTSHRPPSNPSAPATSAPSHMGLPPPTSRAAAAMPGYPPSLEHPGLSAGPHAAALPAHPASHAEAAAASSAPAIVTSAATGTAHPLLPPAPDSRPEHAPAPAPPPAGLASNGFPPPAVYSGASYPPLYAPYATTLQHTPYLPPAAASPRNTTDTRTSLSASPLVAPKTPKGVRPHTPGSTGAAGAALTYSPRGPSPTRERESFSNISSLSRSTPAAAVSAPPPGTPLAPALVAPLAAPLSAPIPGPLPGLGAPLQNPLVAPLGSGLTAPLAAPTPTPAAPTPSHLSHSLAPVPTVPSISSSAKPPAHWGVTPSPAERAGGFAPVPPLFGAQLAPQNPNPFSAESLFQTSPGADLLRRELDSRFLAAAGAAGAAGGAGAAVREMHHHQHQHTHVHQHPPPPAPHPHHPHHLLMPHPPIFKDVSKMSSLYRSGIGLGYPYSSSLLHPAAPYVPPQPLSYAPTKKSGKWNAMHVRIAWEIYNHQQKEKSGGNSAAVAAAGEKDKLRAFPAPAPPPPAAYRSPYELPPAPYLPHHPHLGTARYDERVAYAASLAQHTDRGLRVAGVSPFARYGPAGYPGAPPGYPLSAYGRELALSSSLHGVHHASLAPLHDPWRAAAAARAPQPPPALAAADAVRRDHEERERERARREREDRERRDRDERERRKAREQREQRDREMERARVRSPLRNGTLEPKEERKEMPRHPPTAMPGYGPPPPGPAWDPYRAFDPLQHMRFAPLVEAAIRAEEDRAKMLSAYAHHQQMKAGPLARALPPLGAHAHALPLPPLAPPLAPLPLAPLDLLKKEEPR